MTQKFTENISYMIQVPFPCHIIFCEKPKTLFLKNLSTAPGSKQFNNIIVLINRSVQTRR